MPLGPTSKRLDPDPAVLSTEHATHPPTAPEPHPRARFPVVGVRHLSILVDHLGLAVGERHRRASVIVPVQGERLLRHDDGLPHRL